MAQPQLAQAHMAGTQQWMQSGTPEIQGKLTKAIQAHGWTAGGQAKPRQSSEVDGRSQSGSIMTSDDKR